MECLSFSFFFIILKSCKEFHSLQLLYFFINDSEQNPWRHFDRKKDAGVNIIPFQSQMGLTNLKEMGANSLIWGNSFLNDNLKKN